MNEQIEGKKLNKKLLSYIDSILEEILEDGKNNSTEFTNGAIPLGDDGTCIKADDLDLYNAIMEMKNFFERKNLSPEDTYVIPRVSFQNEDGVEQLATMYVSKNDAVRIAEKATYYEQILGIRFPVQLFQLQSRYANSKVPGTNLPLPEPRLLSETAEQYEERLEHYYASAGIARENIADTNIRQPYTHEQVDYRTSDEVVENFESEYYDHYRRKAGRRAINPTGPSNDDDTVTPPAPGTPNEPMEVTESEDYDKTPLLQRIGSALNITGNSIKSQSNHQKLKTLAVLGGVGAGAAVLLTTPATQPVVFAALSIGAIYAGAKALTKLSKKHLAPKLRDLFFGKSKKKKQPQSNPTPSSGTGTGSGQGTSQPQTPPSTGGQGGQQTPDPVPNPTGTGGEGGQPQTGDGSQDFLLPDVIENFLTAVGYDLELYKDLENRLIVAKDELGRLNPNSPEYATKNGEVIYLTQQLKEQLQVISAYTRDFMDSLDINNTLEGEGRTHGNN